MSNANFRVIGAAGAGAGVGVLGAGAGCEGAGAAHPARMSTHTIRIARKIPYDLFILTSSSNNSILGFISSLLT
jgi:hypothetical protein